MAAARAEAQVGSPWGGQDVGGPTPAGSAVQAGTDFTIDGGGAEIWDVADQFHYVSQQVTGDVAITAQVTGILNTNAQAKAGLMIREGLATDARHVTVAVTPTSGVRFNNRFATGSYTQDGLGSASSAPRWLRLLRCGNTFTAYESADGAAWTVVAAYTNDMSTTAFVGLAVTSHDTSTLCQATFANVTVDTAPVCTSGATPIPPASGSGLIGEYWDNQGGGVAPTFPATPPDLTQVDARIDFADWGGTWPPVPPLNANRNDFLVRWTGSVVPRFSGPMSFHAVADDGIRVRIDTQLLIDNWTDSMETHLSGTITLTAGTAYSLVVEYYEHGGGASVRLGWSSFDQPYELIPSTQLYTAAAPPGGGPPGGGGGGGGGASPRSSSGDGGRCGCGMVAPTNRLGLAGLALLLALGILLVRKP